MPTIQSRTGIWFAVIVAAVLALWFGGNELYTRMVILPREYPRLEPGSVSLIGMKVPGYHIVVSNGVARLSVGEAGAFARPDEVASTTGKVIPMKGLIGTLRFNPVDAAELVTAINEIKSDIEPLKSRIWTKERIQEALGSEGEARDQLEYDLATSVSGKGIERVNWDRLTTGIWLEVPVPLDVPSATGTRVVTAKVLMPFRTRLATAAANNFQRMLDRGGLGDDMSPTSGVITGVYNQALDDAEAQGFEDVASVLKSRFSEESVRALADPVLKILNEIEVLVTERTIENAELESQPREDGNGDVYSITLETKGESRDRLWQYTYRRPGSQLLLVSNGIAIAAPAVQHEIKYSTVEITGISEKKLAEEALQFIRAASDKNP